MHLQYLQFNTYKKLRIFLRGKMVPIEAFTEQCSQVSNRVSKCFNFVLCLECHFNFISSLCSRASHSCSLDTCITEMFPNQFSLGTASQFHEMLQHLHSTFPSCRNILELFLQRQIVWVSASQRMFSTAEESLRLPSQGTPGCTLCILFISSTFQNLFGKRPWSALKTLTRCQSVCCQSCSFVLSRFLGA